jgi:hypothetical protein
VNNAVINMDVQVPLLILDIHSFGYIRVEMLDYMTILHLVSVLRSLLTIYHKGCTNLHSHHQSMRITFSPHPCQHLLLFVFLMVSILTGAKEF